ncbi:MAG: PepSY domain-containing protein [Rhodanobacteraceae bacterium]
MQTRMLVATLSGALMFGAVGMAWAQDTGTTTRQTTTTTTTTFQKPSGALDEDAIKGDIAQAGYKEVKGLEFKNGVWEAKARGGNDNWVRIKVAPLTGTVYEADAPSKLNEDEVKAKLSAQGFQNVDDVEFDDGLWSASAQDSSGHDVDLLVDPNDGSVVAKSQD